MANFILKGAPYPITKTPLGYLYSQKGVRQIKSDLLALLLTNPRERVMTPDFGTDFRSLMFEPADTILATAARAMIIAAIAKWEPRIAVAGVQVTIDTDTHLL